MALMRVAAPQRLMPAVSGTRELCRCSWTTAGHNGDRSYFQRNYSDVEAVNSNILESPGTRRPSRLGKGGRRNSNISSIITSGVKAADDEYPVRPGFG